MKKENDLIIHAEERYGKECFNDSISNKNSNDSRRPQGVVEIYEVDENGNKQLLRKSNLIVYFGRETIMQSLFNQENSYTTCNVNDHLYWFGLGDGGVDPSDPFNPTPPSSTDTELSNKIPISATDTTCGDLNTGFYYKCPFDSVLYEQDTANDGYWLISKVTTTIQAGYANDYILSEAGLYTAVDDSPGYSPGSSEFRLFAKITFPGLTKTISRRLIFIWYLYF